MSVFICVFYNESISSYWEHVMFWCSEDPNAGEQQAAGIQQSLFIQEVSRE